MLSSFEVKCGTRAAGRKPVRGVVFIATTAEALADERLPFLTKQLSLADVEARGGNAAAQVRADSLRIRIGTIKEQAVAAATAEWDDMDEDRWEEHLDGLKRGTFGGWECDMCMGFNGPKIDVCALCCR